MNCRSCGNEVNASAKFCRKCGSEIKLQTEALELKAEAPKKKKDKGLSFLIVLLGIVLIASASVIGYIYFQNSSVNIDIPSIKKSDTDERTTGTEDINDGDVNETTEQKNDVVGSKIIDDDFPPPVFEEISASSNLASQGGSTYYARNAADGKMSTAWVEGVSGSGIGEMVTFQSATKQKVSNIKIMNDYCKSEEIYRKNNRVKSVHIVFSDGTSLERNLEDEFADYNLIVLSEPIICDEFSIAITDVYRGTHYDDTCISEIVVG